MGYCKSCGCSSFSPKPIPLSNDKLKKVTGTAWTYSACYCGHSEVHHSETRSDNKNDEGCLIMWIKWIKLINNKIINVLYC